MFFEDKSANIWNNGNKDGFPKLKPCWRIKSFKQKGLYDIPAYKFEFKKDNDISIIIGPNGLGKTTFFNLLADVVSMFNNLNNFGAKFENKIVKPWDEINFNCEFVFVDTANHLHARFTKTPINFSFPISYRQNFILNLFTFEILDEKEENIYLRQSYSYDGKNVFSFANYDNLLSDISPVPLDSWGNKEELTEELNNKIPKNITCNEDDFVHFRINLEIKRIKADKYGNDVAFRLINSQGEALKQIGMLNGRVGKLYSDLCNSLRPGGFMADKLYSLLDNIYDGWWYNELAGRCDDYREYIKTFIKFPVPEINLKIDLEKLNGLNDTELITYLESLSTIHTIFESLLENALFVDFVGSRISKHIKSILSSSKKKEASSFSEENRELISKFGNALILFAKYIKLREIFKMHSAFNNERELRYFKDQNQFLVTKHDYDNMNIRVHHHNDAILVSELSSGELSDVMIFFELLFPYDVVDSESEISDYNKNYLYLIDEPEVSTHIAWQEMYVNQMNEIISATSTNILIATHSPHIVADHLEMIVRPKYE